ncbi:HPP family protein [Geminocystis sp. NIES-3709]|uniref:HPP family protein n=1 Tax=Geminocystis sp. NIES-3709 TaxID=1617448 RepID=UPI0005FCD4BE|nr:HPP family protein [Geminocystis sp. NIES-3709]BAQ66754.1 membrane protein [Geminocystis sp. NIES-3709]
MLKSLKRKLKNKKAYRITRYIIYRETILKPIDHLWTFLGAFFGISLIGIVQNSELPLSDHVFLIGSFGASAVLIYGVTNSPLAQPRNLFGGHLIGAIVGVCVEKIIPSSQLIWVASGFAVALSIVLMQISKTLHPPGGATALIAVIGSAKIKALGFWYVFNPVLSSIFIMFIVAIIFNNIPDDRSYPHRQ